jgi:hypothetical protein
MMLGGIRNARERIEGGMSTSQAHNAQGASQNEKSADSQTLRMAGAILLAAAGLSFGAWQVYGFMQPREIRSASDSARMAAGGPAAAKGAMPAPAEGVDDGIVREFLESTSPAAAAALDTLTNALPAKLTELGDVAMTQASVQGFVGLAMNKLAALMKDGLVGVMDRPAEASGTEAPKDGQEPIRKQVRAQLGPMGTLLEGAKYDLSRARVVSLAEGIGAGMKNARGGGERFASVMRFATSQGTEKDPGGEMRVPFCLKGSECKHDDGEIGIVLRRAADGETWSGGGVNLYLKDPSVMAKLMKDRPMPSRVAAPAPEKKTDGGGK